MHAADDRIILGGFDCGERKKPMRPTIRSSISVFFVVHLYFFVLRPVLWPVIHLPLPPGAVFIETLNLMFFSLAHAVYTLGWKRALTFFVLSMVISWLYEEIGVATGAIYGPYHYTDLLGPKLGHVPLLIPIAWFMMIYPSYVVANLIAGPIVRPQRDTIGRMIWLAFMSAMIMTAWDLTMDPGMSSPPDPAWVWEQGGPFFGVPLQNFAGWMLTTFTVYVIYGLIEYRWGRSALAPSERGLEATPLAAYAAVGVHAVLVNEPTLQLIAAFAMGLPVLVAAGRLLFAPQEQPIELDQSARVSHVPAQIEG
jgi:uncharacterized membrane protein